jgi:hypothetical protein
VVTYTGAGRHNVWSESKLGVTFGLMKTECPPFCPIQGRHQSGVCAQARLEPYKGGAPPLLHFIFQNQGKTCYDLCLISMGKKQKKKLKKKSKMAN